MRPLRGSPGSGCIPTGAIDRYGQVIDALVSEKRDLAATRRFLTRALEHGTHPAEVSAERAPAYPGVADEPPPAACHVGERYDTNPIESDHGRPDVAAAPDAWTKTAPPDPSVIRAGHAFIPNIRHGHHEPGTGDTVNLRAPAAPM